MEIDLSELILKGHIEAFYSSKRLPSFSISDDTDVNILFFKREDKYVGIRSSSKTDFATPSEFLVISALIEKLRARLKEQLTLESLVSEKCSDEDLKYAFFHAEKIKDSLPSIDAVVTAHKIINRSGLSWIFLETESEYHSLFWFESESRLFSRSA